MGAASLDVIGESSRGGQLTSDSNSSLARGKPKGTMTGYIADKVGEAQQPTWMARPTAGRVRPLAEGGHCLWTRDSALAKPKKPAFGFPRGLGRMSCRLIHR